MFKSVFIKYISAFMLIILFSFIVLTSIIASLVNSYGTNAKMETLQNVTKSMSKFLQGDFEMSPQIYFDQYLVGDNRDIILVMDVLAANIDDSVIFIADKNGYIANYGGSVNHGLEYESVSCDNGKYCVPDTIIEKLKTSPSLTDDETLDGFFKEEHITYALQIKTDDGEFAGAVFAGTSDTGVDALLNAMIKTVIMSSLWIMLATLVAVYFINDRMISPLKEMSAAAREFAAGRFETRVPVTGNDEVAQLATAMNNMASSLENLEEMRSSFLANVSHDLKTPMTTISGFIDGILSGAIPPENQNHYLEIIASEVRRLARLVAALLDISRLQAGARKFVMSDFDICELAREIIISLEQKIEEKKLDVSFECDRDNMYTKADRDAIHQIMYNICDNGIKFAHEGGKYEIKITQKENKYYISVYNEGNGISAEDLPYVFDRFYKSDKSRGLDKSGVGLGLYIARTIAEAHGEKIWVESEAGKWCCFTFTLPETE